MFSSFQKMLNSNVLKHVELKMLNSYELNSSMFHSEFAVPAVSCEVGLHRAYLEHWKGS